MGRRIPKQQASGVERWSPPHLGREEHRIVQAAASLVFRYVLPNHEETPGLRNLVLDALNGHPTFRELLRKAME